MDRRFYDLCQGGSTDRALPIVVRRIGDIGDQAQVAANHMVQIRSASEQANARIQDLERDYFPMERLIEDLAAAQVEVREYQVQHVALEERVRIVERRLAEFQGASSSLVAPPDAYLHK